MQMQALLASAIYSYILSTYHSHFIPEGVAEVSQTVACIGYLFIYFVEDQQLQLHNIQHSKNK
jgi:hypothetical protein